MNNIRKNRETKGYTQERLAEELSVDRSSVAKWESGEAIPRPKTLLKLSEIFGCTVDELIKHESR